jgi:hypothetical protein
LFDLLLARGKSDGENEWNAETQYVVDRGRRKENLPYLTWHQDNVLISSVFCSWVNSGV